MIETMITTHAILVKIFLGFVALGLGVPYLAGQDGLKFRKIAFIYTMTFQALATMIAFSGVVAYIVGDMQMTLSIGVMIIIWAALMAIEIKKYRMIKTADVQAISVLKLLQKGFVKISLLQLLLIVLTIVLKVLEAKGVVSL